MPDTPINIGDCLGTYPRLDVPCPALENFSYQIDPGIVRTELDAGRARQRRIYGYKPRLYDLSWIVTRTADLKPLVDKLEADALRTGWSYLNLVTDQCGRWVPAEHLVRLVGNVRVELVQKLTDQAIWRVSVQAEQYQDVTDCIANADCNSYTVCLRQMQIQVPQLDYESLDPVWP